MGIFKRISDIARTNLNSWLDHLESSPKLSEQMTIDLDANKKRAHKLLIKALAEAKICEQKRDVLRKRISHLEREAQQYLARSDEENARASLYEKQQAEQEEEFINAQLHQEQNTAEIIRRGLALMDEKIEHVKNQAHLRTAIEATEQEDPFDTFSRMEEKIQNQEDEIEALRELLEQDEKKTAVTKTAANFDHYSDPEAIERELQAMKSKMED